MGNQVIEADEFAVALDRIFGGIADGLNAKLEKPVREACKEAKQVARDSGGYTDRTGVYRDSFAYHVDRKGQYQAVGYVGNKRKAGLVHLLEKGHVNVRTKPMRRTRAFPHMSKGAKAGEKVLIAKCEDIVDEVLR